MSKGDAGCRLWRKQLHSQVMSHESRNLKEKTDIEGSEKKNIFTRK